MSTATRTKTAKKWTCDQCGVSIAQIDGSRVRLPRDLGSRQGRHLLPQLPA